MQKKILILSFLVLIAVITANAQTGLKRDGNILTFSNAGKELRLEFCTSSMFRVRSAAAGKFEANEGLMVVNYNWQPVAVKTTDRKSYFLLQTDKLNVRVFKAPFRIDVLTKDSKILSSETPVSGGVSSDGDSVTCTKQLLPDEHFFGFGERMDFIDRRNKKVRLNVGRGKGMPHIIGAYNILEANYSPVPFFMSTRGYGIFLHNSAATDWDMGFTNPGRYSFKAESGEMDYYFMYGPGFPSILAEYTSLTGRTPLLPEFAFGLHAGTYSGGTWGHEALTSDKYVIELARKFREMGIPVDLLWLDSTWRIFGKNGGSGATTFEWRSTFNDPKGMFDSLYAMNYKMVGLHVRPRFDNGDKLNLLDQARAKAFVYPEENNKGEFINFFDSNAVNWWWKNGAMRVASIGAKFFKTDEGSAFAALANESDKTGPTSKEAIKLHNVFPIAYAKAPFEKFQEYNGMRGLNQTREGYAGIQRYPFIFAGDWPSQWQYFAPVIKAGINIGLSGVSDWAHCMGGFEQPADPELYIRWVQFGMFSPIALVFGMDHPGYKEPWNYGEQALKNFKKYDALRYRLIPYIYSNAFVNHQTGMPLMRALVLEYQDDPNVYDIVDQYLFGENLMVCPVTTKGAVTRTVYLPEGKWIDYWTGKPYNGKQYIHVLSPLDTIPLFVKAGAIIPMQPEMKYFGEKPADVITLDIFPYQHSSFTLYEDDGESLDYQKGTYALTKISVSAADKSLKITVKKPEGKYIPAQHRYLTKIHLSRVQVPSAVTENGNKLAASGSDLNEPGWFYDAKENLLWVKPEGTNKGDINLVVNYELK